MMNALILGETESPEITFDLQVAGDQSVPDAVISQKSFKIVVETKLYNQFDSDQLLRHLNQFASEEIKVLLTLDPKSMKESTLDEFSVLLKNFNAEHQERLHTPIKHVNLTFEQLLTAMEDIVDERDTQIVAVFDDFKKYCFDEGLIPDGYKWMRAIVAGTTIKDNIELGLYYDEASRGYSEHGYIGLYSGKSIRAIGRLVTPISPASSSAWQKRRSVSPPRKKKSATTNTHSAASCCGLVLSATSINRRERFSFAT